MIELVETMQCVANIGFECLHPLKSLRIFNLNISPFLWAACLAAEFVPCPQVSLTYVIAEAIAC